SRIKLPDLASPPRLPSSRRNHRRRVAMGRIRILCVMLVCSSVTSSGCYSAGTIGGPEVNPSPIVSAAPVLLSSPVSPSASELPATPLAQPGDRPLPINLPTALQLANVRAVDVAAASERIQVATAVLKQSEVLWLPTITVGGDYARHDGRNQDAQ